MALLFLEAAPPVSILCIPFKLEGAVPIVRAFVGVAHVLKIARLKAMIPKTIRPCPVSKLHCCPANSYHTRAGAAMDQKILGKGENIMMIIRVCFDKYTCLRLSQHRMHCVDFLV